MHQTIFIAMFGKLKSLNVVGLNGFEPLASSLSGTRSNQLSYKPTPVKLLVEVHGFEPRTSCLQSRRSPN